MCCASRPLALPQSMLTSSCLVGPDCMQSNESQGKQSLGGRSLHAVHGDGLNPYQAAIGAIVRTLSAFGGASAIPAYGFGDGEPTNPAAQPQVSRREVAAARIAKRQNVRTSHAASMENDAMGVAGPHARACLHARVAIQPRCAMTAPVAADKSIWALMHCPAADDRSPPCPSPPP